MKIKVFDILGDALSALETFVSDPNIKVLHIYLSPAPAEGGSDRFYVFYEPLGGEEAEAARALRVGVEREELRRLVGLAKMVRDGPWYEAYQECRNQAQRRILLLAHYGICACDADMVTQLLDPAMSSVLEDPALTPGSVPERVSGE